MQVRYLEIANRIRREIHRRHLAPGTRLPVARQLAAQFGANENTVLRALRLLRSEGVLDFGRGRAVTVRHPLPEQQLAALEEVRAVLTNALRAGSSRQHILAVLDEVARAPDRPPV
ncbi:GntR family transcriptional regulator [Pseudonocardia sp. CA-107938]|uniref:GntR family transcriptional regulator n=1 Tax=Pseudonocardia sp. CA-107938 TaxID=3240021 RepID=UPI003D8A1DF4